MITSPAAGMKKGWLSFVIALAVSASFACSNGAVNHPHEPMKPDRVPLPALEITPSGFSPPGGVSPAEARRLIAAWLAGRGVKGPIEAEAEFEEITPRAIWENSGTQLYRVKLRYAWIDGVAIVKGREVLGILSGMPTVMIAAADLDMDNVYEIYSNILVGSGIISAEIRGFNIASREGYSLSRRMKQDLFLFIEDSTLFVNASPYPGGDETGKKTARIKLEKTNDGTRELALETPGDAAP